MSRTPRVTGTELIAALEKAGFRVLRVKGSTISCAMKTGEARSCHSIPGRRSGPAYFAESFETANGPLTKLRNCYERGRSEAATARCCNRSRRWRRRSHVL